MSWNTSAIPDLSGRTFVVTGANSGLGESTTRELAAHGATVIMACRTTSKGDAAAARMSGDLSVVRLDLADLASVRSFAADCGQIDVLINNAGVMALPKLRTADGFEMQIGTNFLGHFALTGLLLPKISSRVVTLSSGMHKMGKIDIDDLNWQKRRYSRWGAYGQSKLADLIFAYELQRRLTANGSPVISLAAHPGYAATELQSKTQSVQDLVMAVGNRILAQSADRGALPTLFAATSGEAVGGAYYGPDGVGELRGDPKRVDSTRTSRDEALASRLWQRAEDLTGVTVG